MKLGHTLTGVEIFRAGKWNQDQYTTDDLDEMVKAFDRVGFQPPVKLGHSTEPGAPAYGWVSKIWRKGEKLLADLAQIPTELYNMIKSGAYRHVSSEIFWQLKRDSQTFPRVLKAVALLGAEVPAVGGLKPLTANLSVPDGHVETYAMPFRMLEDDDDDDGEADMSTTLPSDRLDTMIRNYMHANPGIGYSAAAHAMQVTDEGRQLMAEYNHQKRFSDHTVLHRYKAFETCAGCSNQEGCRKGQMCVKEARRSAAGEGKYADPSAELTKRARQLMAEQSDKKLSFSDAAILARRADPALEAEYHSWLSHRR